MNNNEDNNSPVKLTIHYYSKYPRMICTGGTVILKYAKKKTTLHLPLELCTILGSLVFLYDLMGQFGCCRFKNCSGTKAP